MRQNVKWSTTVRVLTAVCWAVLGGTCLLLAWEASWWSLCWVVVILAALIYLMCLAPLRLEADEGALFVKRMGRTLCLPYSEIVSVEPYRLRGTEVRLWGSGGFMGYTGLFYRKDIGRFHAYVGAWRQAFLVTTRSGRRYVLSCEGRDEMVALLRKHVV